VLTRLIGAKAFKLVESTVDPGMTWRALAHSSESQTEKLNWEAEELEVDACDAASEKTEEVEEEADEERDEAYG
jgi:hypothetical protein